MIGEVLFEGWGLPENSQRRPIASMWTQSEVAQRIITRRRRQIQESIKHSRSSIERAYEVARYAVALAEERAFH